ncbi:hypothetical protein K461DRAFT_290945 [Myriangium duriaei CBS 260.36]|uniref:C2H2-type domain-containing protein n=1 Tax=Myriangium duriaei CBS 260.36 TaxID=1168546 RepID=A0A9P4J757_9PEZI|nr:hypothetical protein K461DRAFT_290945 [Myriangium duriaei CBS 260.36]
MSAIAIKRLPPAEGHGHASKRVKSGGTPELVHLDPRLCSQTSAGNSAPSDLESNIEGVTSDIVIKSQPSTPATTYPCREKNFLCDFPGCGKAYNRPVRLAEHQRSHTNERPFVCKHEGCGKSFLRDSHLKHHVKSQHENLRDWVCDWPGCGQAFATGQRMRTHRKRHEDREQFRCTGFPPCEQQFRKQETLERHIASVHLKDAPYVCEHLDEESGQACEKRFKQASGLSWHREREHESTKPKHFCNQCTPAADEADNTSQQNANGPEAKLTGFSSYSELQVHIKDVHPPTCNHCGHVCSTASQLKAHMDIEHVDLEERRTIPCQEPTCARKFTKKGNMLVHYRSAHEEQKFVCGQFAVGGSKIVPEWDGIGACGRGFATKASLEKHVRTQHLNLPLQPSRGKEKRKQRKARMSEHDHGHIHGDDDEYGHEHRTTRDAGSGLDHGEATIFPGVEYQAFGQLPCAIAVCQQRFEHMSGLESHLETVHGFSALAALDAAEAVCEKEALTGGRFWVGGEEGSGLVEDDHEFANCLTQALGGADVVKSSSYV